MEDDLSEFYKNTIIYYDEDGKKYIRKIGTKDVISYFDEKGNITKKYLRVMVE
jgi:hypothetical protein